MLGAFNPIKHNTPASTPARGIFIRATPVAGPVRICVVDTGSPNVDDTNTVTAAPNSIANPRVGDICVMRLPSVRTT
ncbi:hypothetical protein BO71DRAFT_435282 [Aspergillus ellipticus CBS 707.79]|uniref:Uncharacterized protein n=1 Tax=Aspergillus ellipticus CBS 707.79 TaxID=1448320 RepID=A0A319DD23_9EURO|nr:hypothetical protein BO71DRAFT_435282 [Aspergillus ellipticus CBS 707.79]